MGFRNTERASLAGKSSSRAGVKNKASNEAREAFNLLLQNNLSRIQDDLDSLAPKDRVKIILELARFCVPQLQSVSIEELNNSNEQQFEVITIHIKNEDHDNNN